MWRLLTIIILVMMTGCAPYNDAGVKGDDNITRQVLPGSQGRSADDNVSAMENISANMIASKPDLIITGVTHISGLIYYRVKNIGGSAAGPSDTWLYDLSHMHRDTSWVEGLGPGEERTLPFTNYDWNGNEITICADGGRTVDESNENNNCYQPFFGFAPSYKLLSFAAGASWRGSAGRVKFGQGDDRVVGGVNMVSNIVAEDGNSYTNAVMVTTPATAYGWVEGIFGEYVSGWQTPGYMIPLEMPMNYHLTARVGFVREADPSARARFKVGVMEEDGWIEWLAEKSASVDGRLDSIDVDLSACGGKKVMFLLRTESDNRSSGVSALWLDVLVAPYTGR